MRAAAVALAVALAGCASEAAPAPAAGSAAAPAASPIPAASTQLITTVVDDWAARTGTMHLWHRVRGTGVWKSDGAWSVVVGKSGTAWGRGLHGDGAPPGRGGPVKAEGDGAAPAGAFELRGAYGYAEAPPDGTALTYAPLTAATECVDDPASAHYTQILARPADADWRSAEKMRRRDALYTWVIDVAHNPDATRGAGSCIFLHVWRSASAPTVGCTAMAEPNLRRLLTTLAPAAAPVYVLLPRAEYAAAQTAWGLPDVDAAR